MSSGLAACTSVPPPAVARPAAQAASTASYGTIVSMRDVRSAEPPPGGSGADIRIAILGAIEGDGRAMPIVAGPGEEMVEFIVHEDDGGQPVSVMQMNDARLHAGERVLLTRGGRTHISRVGV